MQIFPDSGANDSTNVLALSIPGAPDPSIPIAAARAGAVGILDLELAADEGRALEALATMARLAGSGCGVRLGHAPPPFARAVLDALTPPITALVVSAASLSVLQTEVAAAQSRGMRLLVEILSADELPLAERAGADGVIVRGLEAGGFIGEATTFILVQQVVARTRVPVWAHGGIGLHTAAACRAGGAAGIVLDVQLALTRESALPPAAKAALGRMDGSETVCLGEDLGEPFRAFARPAMPAIEELKRCAERLADDDRPLAERAAEWRAAIRERVGWSDERLWPAGQDAAFAAALARRFVTVGGVIAGFRAAIADHIRAAVHHQPLADGAPLATSHGTRYPILQGPMTRVSDTAPFAESVAAGGALPFLALALLRGPEVRALMEETQRRLGDRPWGVGILGFVPLELRQEQLEVIRDIRPPFALIAGGRPDQAMSLEEAGIRTYLHVPSPALLRMFVEAGARRFVFEGRECGGHVGPRSSFVLWNTMVDALLDAVPGTEIAEACHVVFAGGVHDATSSAMVAALAAPLVDRGFKVGVLLGTGYLFTEEAVRDGAITRTFQDEAVACARTVLLETGPGHATRCVATPFVEAFEQERRRLRADGRTPEEIRDALEELNLGRLRIASKGIARNPRLADDGQRFATVPEDAQRREGMYMIGQVAMLRDRVCTIADLHADVAAGGSARLAALTPDRRPVEVSSVPRPADIAIIGMSCTMPKAPDLQTFWSNILNKVDAITEIPPDRFDWRTYYDPDMRARDKIYSKWGGFLDPVPFDPVRYGMPPNSLSSIEPLHLLMLEAVRSALDDAGYGTREFDRPRTGIVAGVGGGVAELGQRYGLRSALPMYFPEVPGAVWNALPEWTEDSFAGIITNVAAGRVANRFDLGGVNYTVDAACASSLAALYAGVRELESGAADMMIVAGADTVQSPFGYLCFSKTRALSPNGRCRTFDESADGIVISEGLAVVVLKRLADAERDGDRIYAVIKSVAGSSDGRDRSMTAPRPEGQMLALQRAYAMAGFLPATVGLVEAHGTGTVAGDQAEIEALTRVFRAAGDGRQWCAVGSVKSMIGHTKCAAGLAGLLKIAKAVYHKILPPTLGVEQPNRKARFEESPFYVNSEARPWIAADDTPRRAGVSSFGFGGTNFHAVIEEYRDRVPSVRTEPTLPAWPSELFLFGGRTAAEVADALAAFETALEAGAGVALRALAAKAWERFAVQRREETLVLAVVGLSVDDLRDKVAAARTQLLAGKSVIEDRRGIYFTASPLGRAGGVAFLFPGQGSQYPDMLRELGLHFDEVRDTFEAAAKRLRGRFPEPLTAYVFPPPAFSQEDERLRQEALKQTQIAQPSLGAAGLAMFRLLGALNVRPDAAAGHSYGEFVALCAADAFDADTLYDVSERRGRAIVETARGELGTMAAVQAAEPDVARVLNGTPGVWIANVNSPRQTVISGTQVGIDLAVRQLEASGLAARAVAVACAFHSPLVADAGARFSEHLATVAFATPSIPVYSNVDARPYVTGGDALAASLREHLVRPVRFRDEIEAMYDAGCRVFVEVGPRNILSGLVQQTLEGRPFLAVPTDLPARPGLVQLMHAVGMLAAHGVNVSLDRLFAGRHGGVERPAAPTPTTWMVTGGAARPLHEPRVRTSSNGHAARHEAPSAVSVPPRAVTSPPADRQPEIRPVVSVVAPPQKPVVASSPPAPVLASPTSPQGDLARWDAGGVPTDAAEVMLQFQRTMARFLDTQRNVMLAYLGVADEGAPTEPSRPAPSERRRVLRMPASLPVRVVAHGGERAGVMLDFSSAGTKIRVEGGVPDGAEVTVRVARREGQPSLSLVAMLVRTDADGQAFCFVNTAPEDLARLERLVSTGEPAEPPLARVVEVEAPIIGPRIDGAWVQTELLRIASERTGYPAEMLDLDAPLEADLGIDSIKRVEILGALRKSLPDVVGAHFQGQMEVLTRARTLRDVVQIVSDVVAGHAGPPAAPALRADPVAAGPVRDTGWIREQVLRVVGERTGYPPEMLDLDAGMEADLGIDSIKRVEILGAFSRLLPAPAADRLQAEMEVLTRARSLADIIETAGRALADSALEPPIAPRETGPGEAGGDSTPAIDADALCRTVLEIVSERTGYPAEMLDLDAAMEADLGIDSIKRVEILGAFRNVLPPGVTERVQAHMEALTRARSLRALAQQLADLTTPGARSELAPPAVGLNGRHVHHADPVVPEARLPRCVPVTADCPVRGSAATLASRPGAVVITEDALGVAERLSRALHDRGIPAVIVSDGAGLEAVSPDRYRLPLDDASATAALAGAVAERHGAIVGLVHLAPLADHDAGQAALDEGPRRARRDVKTFHRLVMALGRDIAESGGVVLGVTGSGGHFAFADARAHPASAGVTGLVKTLAIEWPGTRCRAVDLDPAETSEALCAALLAELDADDGETETGWRHGQRSAVRVRAARHDDGAPADWLGAGAVVLITGGARGITGEIAEEIARLHRPTLILVGRHALSSTAEPPATAGLETAADLKRALLTEMTRDGRRPSVADVERAYQALIREREIRRRIGTMEAAGATVVYRSLDVRDTPALTALVEEVYATYNRLDGVIHGAGVIEDRLLLDKTIESFNRVFDTKVDSAFALAMAVRPGSLRFLVFFSSVAGRYGNRGQADYVAANEVLNKLARWLDARWPARVVALNWGPWAGSGMVSDAVARQFAERGVGLVPPALGRRAFVDELALGTTGDAEVVLGAGPWERQAAQHAVEGAADLPLLSGAVPGIGAGGAVELVRRLDPAEDLYLDDHRLDGNPVFPAACAAELMAECVQTAWADWRLIALRSFQLLRGVVLQNGPTSVRIVARESAPGAGDILTIEVELFEGERTKPSYRAIAELSRQAPEPFAMELPAASTLDRFPMSAEAAYDEWLFHGPRFQCLTSIDGIGDWELLATVRPSRPADCLRRPGAGSWWMDPVVLDSGLQLVLLLTRAKWDVSGLPAAFTSLRVFGSPESDAIRCYLKMRPGSDEHGARSDVYYTTLDGRVLAVLECFESSSSRALNRLMGAAGRHARE